jgi:wyosine [tRNA(Phe)-imidazoG37] synthetase (radical SAM superfamily)
MRLDRAAFYDPEEIAAAVRERIQAARSAGQPIDYLSFVPDGEPTLDLNLQREIALLKPLGIPIAVISNASLISREDVRNDLMQADWVSLKVDAVDQAVWRRVDRPHRKLNLAAILEGALVFSRDFQGELVTETMLAADINDDQRSLRNVAEFLARLQPKTAYLSIPTRPPAEKRVRAPAEQIVNRGYQIFREQVPQVEYLTGYEGDAFASTGDVQQDLLSITAVHPMRQEAVDVLLKKAGADWAIVDQLIAQQAIVKTRYADHNYYMRKFRRRE